MPAVHGHARGARGEGDEVEAQRLLALAADLFERAEHVLDAARCRQGLTVPTLGG